MLVAAMRRQVGDGLPMTANNNASTRSFDGRNEVRKMSLGIVNVH